MDFPEPDGPITHTTSPPYTSVEMSFNTSRLPNFLFKCYQIEKNFLSLTTDVARDGIKEMYENGQITSSQHFATSEEAVNFFVGMFGGIGIFLLLYSIVIIANVVVSFVAKAKSSKPVYIVSLVISIFASNVFSIVGSILGLVSSSIKQEE